MFNEGLYFLILILMKHVLVGFLLRIFASKMKVKKRVSCCPFLF